MTSRQTLISTRLTALALLGALCAPALRANAQSPPASPSVGQTGDMGTGAICSDFFSVSPFLATAQSEPALLRPPLRKLPRDSDSKRFMAWAERLFADKIAELEEERQSALNSVARIAPQPAPETIEALNWVKAAGLQFYSPLRAKREAQKAEFNAAIARAHEALGADTRLFSPPLAPPVSNAAKDHLITLVQGLDWVQGMDVPTAIARLLVEERLALRLDDEQTLAAATATRLYIYQAALRYARSELRDEVKTLLASKPDTTIASLLSAEKRIERDLRRDQGLASLGDQEILWILQVLRSLEEVRSGAQPQSWMPLIKRFELQLPIAMRLPQDYVERKSDKSLPPAKRESGQILNFVPRARVGQGS